MGSVRKKKGEVFSHTCSVSLSETDAVLVIRIPKWLTLLFFQRLLLLIAWGRILFLESYIFWIIDIKMVSALAGYLKFKASISYSDISSVCVSAYQYLCTSNTKTHINQINKDQTQRTNIKSSKGETTNNIQRDSHKDINRNPSGQKGMAGHT